MCFYGSAMSSQAIDLVGHSASNFVDSAYRWAENHYERMPELVSRHITVIAARKALCLSAR
jgi:hypothetical protein